MSTVDTADIDGSQMSANIARVCIDSPLSHLDRLFDYLIPEELTDQVVVGCRVRVRFAGRLLDGFVLDRVVASEHPGRLTALARVTSSEPVLSPVIARLARKVADRYAGTLSDVLRLAVPPRRARAEQRSVMPPTPALAIGADIGAGWSRYRHGPSYLDAVSRGRAARAVWTVGPGEDWPRRLAEAAAVAAAGGRGALIVAPDARDVRRLDAALEDLLGGTTAYAVLTADLKPEERYRRFLAVRRGEVGIVIGTRAAAFAPVADLGLVVIWDDGDDLHAELRAPYPHAREIVLLRSHLEDCAALVAGWARSAEAAALIESGWAHELVAERDDVRRCAPRIRAAGDDVEQERDEAARSARLPSLALRVARETLAAGAPVLVQVPRAGYLPSLTCDRCRAPARCRHCAGPVGQSAAESSAISCHWCGRPATDWVCAACGNRRLRAAVVGAGRTAEELGRAFPGVVIRTAGRAIAAGSRRGTVPASGRASDGPRGSRAGGLRVEPGSALVVSTPGAEPLVDGGYGAALLLDGWALLGRSDLRAGEETLRRWLGAASLVRSAADGGQVVIMADGAHPVVQALIRWDPAGLAGRELTERRELGFPPAVRLATLTGTRAAVDQLMEVAVLPASAEILGPVPVPDDHSNRAVAGPAAPNADEESGPTIRFLVRAPRADGAALAKALHVGQALRSAAKASEHVRVQFDPVEIG